MSSRRVRDELREILSRFQYMSRRPGVGLRQLEEHHIRALVGKFEPILAAKDARIAELEARVDRQSKLILVKEQNKQELLGLLKEAVDNCAYTLGNGCRNCQSGDHINCKPRLAIQAAPKVKEKEGE